MLERWKFLFEACFFALMMSVSVLICVNAANAAPLSVENSDGVVAVNESLAEIQPHLNQIGESSQPESGWDSNKEHYYENGEMVCSREIYDQLDGNWYWVEADGSVARNKDVHLQSNGGKWVRYDADGHMVKGEDYRYGGWYYFDLHTGAMAKGMTYVPSNGGKWVYYDWTTGKMRYGEQYVDYDVAHTGWYDFDGCTGAMTYGFYYNSSQNKWVYYDTTTGKMFHGQHVVNNHWYYFDDSTGAVQYGFVYLSRQQKWVFYDRHMGRMLYGEQPIDGAWYLLDAHTGAVRYGWQWVKGKHVCYNWPDGKMLYGRQNVNGSIYYFDSCTGAVDTKRSAKIPQDTVSASAPGFGASIRQGRYRSVRVLGDSIAAGFGASESQPPTSHELFQLEGTIYYEPSPQTPSALNSLRRYLNSYGVSMTNASAPGVGSYSAYDAIGNDTLGNEDAAVVILGANDRLRQSDVNGFSAVAESYLNRVSSHYGSPNVYVIANIDTLSDPRSLTMRQENGELRRICDRHGWQYASLYSAFHTVGKSTGLPQQALYTDGIHPNRQGQDVMWRSISQLLGL